MTGLSEDRHPEERLYIYDCAAGKQTIYFTLVIVYYGYLSDHSKCRHPAVQALFNIITHSTLN